MNHDHRGRDVRDQRQKHVFLNYFSIAVRNVRMSNFRAGAVLLLYHVTGASTQMRGGPQRVHVHALRAILGVLAYPRFRLVKFTARRTPRSVGV